MGRLERLISGTQECRLSRDLPTLPVRATGNNYSIRRAGLNFPRFPGNFGALMFSSEYKGRAEGASQVHARDRKELEPRRGEEQAAQPRSPQGSAERL